MEDSVIIEDIISQLISHPFRESVGQFSVYLL